MTLSESLTCLMDLADIRPVDLCRRVDSLEKGYLSKLLSGKFVPSWDRMVELTEGLGVSPDEFLRLQRAGIVPESYRRWVRSSNPERFDAAVEKWHLI